MSGPDDAAPAAPPAPSAAFLLITLGRRVREEVEVGLRGHGLSLRLFSALGHLNREPGLSYSELGRRAGVSAQSMQATLRQLEDRGAVERRSQPGRGRIARLHVTEIGAALLAAGFTTMAKADRRLLADVPAEQREALTRGLLTAFLASQ